MARYGVVVYWPDMPEAGEQILLHAVAVQATFPQGLADSRAVLDTPADAFTTYSIQLNGTEKATLTFPETSSVGMFSCPATWVARPGDRLEIFAPDPADTAAAGVAITLMGTQADEVNLSASLTASASIKSTMDHVFLFATLECEADISVAKLNLGNLFANTILRSESALITAHLTEVPSFRCLIGPDGGTELNSFLTVEHDQSLFL